MAQQDDGRWEDRLLMVSHNDVVALVLPHQIRDGLYLHIHIAGKRKIKMYLGYSRIRSYKHVGTTQQMNFTKTGCY